MFGLGLGLANPNPNPSPNPNPRLARGHVDKVVPTTSLISAQSPAQSADAMQQAIGFAIREEMARSGDLHGAVAKVRYP